MGLIVFDWLDLFDLFDWFGLHGARRGGQQVGLTVLICLTGLSGLACKVRDVVQNSRCSAAALNSFNRLTCAT